MYIIVLALANTLIWTIITLRWKQLREKGLSSVSSFGLLCSGIPFWLIAFAILDRRYDIFYSQEYLLYVFLWSAVAIFAALGSLFLMKFQALSEQTVYRLGFSTALGILVDSVFFKTTFDYYTITGIIFMFISGILLSRGKKKNGNDEMGMLSVLAAVLAISILGVFQTSIYKYALPIQPHPVIHGIISQLMIYTLYIFFTFRYLKKDYKKHIYNGKDIAGFGLLIFVFTIIEAFLFQALPVTILILLSVINLLIYALYDIRRKELTLSRQIYLAGALSISALIMLNI